MRQSSMAGLARWPQSRPPWLPRRRNSRPCRRWPLNTPPPSWGCPCPSRSSGKIELRRLTRRLDPASRPGSAMERRHLVSCWDSEGTCSYSTAVAQYRNNPVCSGELLARYKPNCRAARSRNCRVGWWFSLVWSRASWSGRCPRVGLGDPRILSDGAWCSAARSECDSVRELLSGSSQHGSSVGSGRSSVA